MIFKALAKLPVSSEVPIDIIGTEIEAIKQANCGVCSPAAYVERARPVNAPTHNTLTWNDALLGERARREEARSIIQLVVRVLDDAELPPRNVHIQVRGDDGDLRDGYAGVDYVAKRGDLRQQVLREVLGRLRGDLENHQWLTETQPILDAIREVERAYLREHAPLVSV